MAKLASIKTRNTLKVDEVDGEPLRPVSRIFHKPDSDSYILAILGFKTLVDVDHFSTQMIGFAQGHRRFHSPQFGNKEKKKLKWVRTEVDICKHVIAPEINLAEISSGDKFLDEYLHNLTKSGIDMGKPFLWEFHILNGVETSSDVKSVGIGRIHHSLGDGMSLMSYFLTFARNGLTGTPITAAQLIPVTKKASGDEQKKRLKWKIERFWILARNTTVGLSRYLSRKYGEVNENESEGQKSNKAPDIRLRTLVTFNLSATQSTSQVGYVRKLGNRIGFLLYPLHVPSRSNPIDYVHAAKAKMVRKKASLVAHFTNSFTKVLLNCLELRPPDGVTWFGYPVESMTISSYGSPLDCMETSLHLHCPRMNAQFLILISCAMTLRSRSTSSKRLQQLAVDKKCKDMLHCILAVTGNEPTNVEAYPTSHSL